ncbi:asparaginyl-tRNA synthetase [Lodderomyces elongisporus]|uniref:asparaginyl-tRNA synthetase n=1 Tax=Lodderomyces elongisporus TaxID=36914 RepID=UPI002925FDE2|nr:asparaginyl-tRNA synthetase [Lodderomyces elongisporus]WLF81513.1 asparaginyl-tRNA synthetase [Lodderomyces elongisporus]
MNITNQAKCVIKKRFVRLAHKSTLNPTIKHHLAKSEPGELIEARGFVKSVRKSKNIGFLDLADGTTSEDLKVVFQTKEQPKLRVGQTVAVNGEWAESKGKGQTRELRCNPQEPQHSYRIIGDVEEDYPLQKKSTSMQFLRTLPALKHRTSTIASFYRLRSFLETQMIDFFNINDFTKVTPPIITSSDCEGAGETFKIAESANFFEKTTYLTVSTQLHIEALAMALNRVWTLTPCFRAENSNTTRHLCEFWMLEAEISHVEDLEQLLNFTEDMIKYSTRKLIDSKKEYLRGVYLEEELVQSRWAAITKQEKWPRMTYTDAIEYLNKSRKDSEEKLEFGDSLSLEHEKYLAKDGPIFITDYPAEMKPFYMLKSAKFDPEKPTVACYDLLFPDFGELAGGSLREHNYEELVESMGKHGMDVEEMDWYTTLRKNGTIPHGGFGMGWERFVTYLSGHDNVKDVIPFPRAPGLCKA